MVSAAWTRLRRDGVDGVDALGDPAMFRRLPASIDECWQATSEAARSLLRLLAAVTTLRRDQLVESGIDRLAAAWTEMTCSGLVSGSAEQPVISELASHVLGERLQLRPSDLGARQAESLVRAQMDDGLESEALTLVLLRPTRGLVLGMLRRLHEDNALDRLGRSDARTQITGLIDWLDGSAPDADQPWLTSARGWMAMLDGDFVRATHEYESAALSSQDPPARARARLGCAEAEYYRGRLSECARLCTQVTDETDLPEDLRARAAAWLANTHWVRGDLDAAESMLQRASDLSPVRPSAETGAVLNNSASLIAYARGDRAMNAHYRLIAFSHAQRGDLPLWEMRLRANEASAHLEEGKLAEADRTATDALAYAAQHHIDGLAPYLWNTIAETRRNQGRVDEAVAAATAARESALRTGALTPLIAALSSLGHARLHQGSAVRARADFEQALTLDAGEGRHAAVSARLGLVMLHMAERGVEGAGEAYTAMQEVVGGVNALWRGNAYAVWAVAAAILGRSDAREVALAGVAECERIGDRQARQSCRATAAVVSSPPDLPELRASMRSLEEIGAINEVEVWRCVLAALSDDPDDRRAAEEAAASLEARGAHGLLGAAQLVLSAVPTRSSAGRSGGQTVRVWELGRFHVSVSGEPVGRSAWASRRSRQLLQLLASRPTMSATRDQIVHALWPEGDVRPARVRGVISELRATLDPARTRASVVGSDAVSVWLDPETVWVDVHEFRTAAETGRAAAARGELDKARQLLEAAASLWRGDLITEIDSPQVDQEAHQVRVLAGDVHRTLARLNRDENRYAAAAAWWMRALDQDPFDAAAHQGLVRTLVDQGRMGEAAQAHESYRKRMAEIGVPAAPLRRGARR